MQPIEQHAIDAVLYRLGRHSLALVNGVRTVGYDPIAERRGESEEPGSGFACRYRGQNFVVTAAHVLERATTNDLRIFCLPSGGIEYRSPANLRRQDIVDASPVRSANAAIHRCRWEDLALISNPGYISHAEFVDISDFADPSTGEVVHCLGFPSDHSVPCSNRLVGKREERGLALYPTLWTAPILPPPSQEELIFKITDFDPEKHYLLSYDGGGVSKHPRGISGAPVWWENNESPRVWRPNFKFAAICVCCYKKGSVVQAIKASVVLRFLREVLESL